MKQVNTEKDTSWIKTDELDRYGANYLYEGHCSKCKSVCRIPFQPFVGSTPLCPSCFREKKRNDRLKEERW